MRRFGPLSAAISASTLPFSDEPAVTPAAGVEVDGVTTGVVGVTGAVATPADAEGAEMVEDTVVVVAGVTVVEVSIGAVTCPGVLFLQAKISLAKRVVDLH